MQFAMHALKRYVWAGSHRTF